MALGGGRGWGAFCSQLSGEACVRSGMGQGARPGPDGGGTRSTVSASFQVVKPTSAPPMPPVKPGPTGVSPSVPWQCPPQAFR